MGEVTVVVGISGVGKSTVMEEALLLSEVDPMVVNYGTRMVELSQERDLVEHRDELQSLGADTYIDVQMEAARSIVEDAETEDSVLVDTHAAIKNPEGYLPGLPKWTLENLEPDTIVIVDATAKEIHNRIESDERDREVASVGEIEEYRDVMREMASACAVMTGAHLNIIENHDGCAEQAAEELVGVIDR
jgi:Archaeal adenylate kinase